MIEELYKHCMIDIETLGVHSSESLILSLSAVGFNLYQDGPIITKSPLSLKLTVEPQIISNRRIEPTTQKWWSQQPPEASMHWVGIHQTTHPGSVADELTEYLETQCYDRDTLIWSNGVVFDLGNLENLISSYNQSMPWKYNVVRDARTIYQVNEKQREMPDGMSFVSHDPTSDCIKQIWRLWEHWRFE